MKKIYVLIAILVVILGTKFIIQDENEETIKTEPVATTTKPIIIPKPIEKPKYKTVITTLFWVGEAEGEDNGFIQNRESYWDSYWMDHFGGVDDPECRDGYNPCGFKPKENPFYFALPYGDRDADGNERMPLQKNRWIEIKYNEKTCYAQWEDVGPFESDDYAYVFGDAAPKNQFGEKAGLDLSPAVFTCLDLSDNALTEWRFIPDSEVPEGPWKTTVTTTGVSF